MEYWALGSLSLALGGCSVFGVGVDGKDGMECLGMGRSDLCWAGVVVGGIFKLYLSERADIFSLGVGLSTSYSFL